MCFPFVVKPAEVASRRREGHRHLVDGGRPVVADVRDRQPPEVHILEAPSGRLRAGPYPRDGVADDAGREAGVDDHPVRDLAREVEHPGSGGGEIDRDPATSPRHADGMLLPHRAARLEKLADGFYVSTQTRPGRRRESEVEDRAVAGADAEHGAPGRHFRKGRRRPRRHRGVPGQGIDDPWSEPHPPGAGGAEPEAGVDVAVDRLRVGDPDDVETGVLRRLRPAHGLARGSGEVVDAETDRVFVGHASLLAVGRRPGAHRFAIVRRSSRLRSRTIGHSRAR